ncbi:MAG: HlyD family type I secretion periplasmic adaptor subunit [Pseudomonadota bacterium]|nr:HlyD family type I secretion periplasmic adaptor subunit [Pseudomonadota bacterium]QKK06483.1 MAG: HlyD family type I secretion periplasmic adaptor subunit [Pseudomonadota bacterium]
MSGREYDSQDLRQMDVTRDYNDEMSVYGISRREHLLLYTIAAFFVIALLWAAFTELEEVTRGDGKIIPSSQIQVIQSLEGGIIEEFLVHEGDTVQADQILLRMRNVQAKSEYASQRKRYVSLLAALERLKAEAEGKEPHFSDELIKEAPDAVRAETDAYYANMRESSNQSNVLEQQLSQRRQEVTELRKRISDLRSIVALTREEQEMIKPAVARGAAPQIELIQIERRLAEQQSELNGLRLALPRSESAVNEAEEKIKEQENTFRARAQRELASIRPEMVSLKETLATFRDREERTEIRSPVHGTVKDMKITTVGGVVRPGDPILEIVPLGDNLLIEAQVRPSDIAFLYPGQKAVVKITAYDFSIYGGLDGEVVDISADTIVDERGESFYRVRVRTNETVLTYNGKEHQIIPGMTAGVDIITGKKSIMDYLLKPFIKASRTALRER